MFQSIRWRIIIPYTILILISMIGIGFYLSNSIYQAQLQTLQDRLHDDAAFISDSLNTTGWLDIDNRTQHWAAIINARVTIIGADGIVLGESDLNAAQMDNHLHRPEIQDAAEYGFGSHIRYSQSVGYNMLYIAIPVTQAEYVIGFVRVALPLEEIAARQAQLRNTILAVILATASLATLLSVFIALRVTRPIEELTQAAQHMTQNDISRLTLSTREDEVGQLAYAFNALVKKLQNQIHALQSEQGKLASVLEKMTDGVIIADSNERITLINQAAEQLFNTQAATAIESTLAKVLRQHQWIELWRQCKDSGSERSTTLEIPRRGIFIQGIALPLDEALPGHILMLFQDLTRVRRLETVRRDFISNISHELRTPLASLKALTETLQSGALEDPPAAKRFLELMETEVDALSHMVSELLELTRIESGQVPLELKPTAPHDILTLASDRLKMQAERAGVELILECPGNLASLHADPPRLGQVLVNLLHNAIKFTPAGGQIILTAQQHNDIIQFSVQDSGIGIPADDLPRIFERFYKTDRARSGGGTGLGLAIARHLVEAHGGEIWVESIQGEGSTFHFTIPIT